VATGLGEIGETTSFLENMVNKAEVEPKPARFINSVHNSVAAQIAINFGFLGENHTVTHGAVSFELALWQAMALLRAGRAKYAVLCGVDELSPYFALMGEKLGWWNTQTKPGEGSAAFVLTKGDLLGDVHERLKIAALKVRPQRPLSGSAFDPQEEKRFIEKVLSGSGIGLCDIDLVLVGAQEDGPLENPYNQVMDLLSAAKDSNLQFAVYKQSCGEYCTASAMGTALAVKSLRSGFLSSGIKGVKEAPMKPEMKNVMIYHLTKSGYRSVCLLCS
jgi:hypothetical protein